MDEPALLQALDSGQVGGAALDVFDQEPMAPDHPFLDRGDILLSPHVAGMDEQSHQDSCTMVADILVQLHEGSWPDVGVVNRAARDGWQW